MRDDDLLRHFFGGFVRLHILFHAEKEAICGVEMIEELERQGYKLSPGTLYPILHHLEDAGYRPVRMRSYRASGGRITTSPKKAVLSPHRGTITGPAQKEGSDSEGRLLFCPPVHPIRN